MSIDYVSSSAAMNDEGANFNKFFECWLVEQDRYLNQLISASKQYEDSSISRSGSAAMLRSLIDTVVRHYEEYYGAKWRWVKLDVWAMLSPSWRTSLEDAFLWIGGWRPSMAFHLLYSKSGLQLQARLPEILRGLSTGDLGDLSAAQLSRVDELQKKTIKEEKDLSEDLARHQETVADSSMVELSHIITELMREDQQKQEEQGGDDDYDKRVESTLLSKQQKLESIVHKADDLRLNTLRSIVDLLNPIQAVHFLIAAAELHLRLHDWGKKRDASSPAHPSLAIS